MSDPHRPTNTQRPRHAAQGTGAPGVRSDPQLRLRVVRRAEPDMRRLVEWVLNMTQARYDAHLAGEPDPYDLPAPDELATESRDGSADERVAMEPEPLDERSTA